MSRNDVILVVKDTRKSKHWYYVLQGLNADTQWSKKIVSELIIGNLKKTKRRATALILAHNKQKKINTEYGVREITI